MGKNLQSTDGSSLAEILERVLDKGIVIAGDISIALADIELLTIRIRLLVSSVDKAKELGINWWEHDPYLVGEKQEKEKIKAMEDRIQFLESRTQNSSETQY